MFLYIVVMSKQVHVDFRSAALALARAQGSGRM